MDFNPVSIIGHFNLKISLLLQFVVYLETLTSELEKLTVI